MLKTTGQNKPAGLGVMLQARMALKRVWLALDTPTFQLAQADIYIQTVYAGCGDLTVWPGDEPLIWLAA